MSFPDGTLMRVLLVEDDEAWLHLTREAFIDVAPTVAVEPAVDARMALALLREEPRPDVVVLDAHLPGAGGYELLREIRAARWGRDLPVIVLTASVDAAERQDLVHLGVAAILTKPTSYAALRELAQLIARADFDGLPG